MRAPGVSSVWGLAETGSLCPRQGWAVPLQACSEIRDLSAGLGRKWQLFKCCRTCWGSGARTG